MGGGGGQPQGHSGFLGGFHVDKAWFGYSWMLHGLDTAGYRMVWKQVDTAWVGFKWIQHGLQ